MSRLTFTSRLIQLRNRHFLLIDILLLVVTPGLALMLRLDGMENVSLYAPALVYFALLGLMVRLAIFFRMGLYRRYWRFASVDDLIRIALAVMLSSALLWVLYQLCSGWVLTGEKMPLLPRSVPIIDSLLLLIGIATPRFMVRFADNSAQIVKVPHGKARRVGIMGAGYAGVAILREIRKNPRLGLDAICFFDDDRNKQHVDIHGIPVLGDRNVIPLQVAELGLDLVIFAMPTASGRTIREIVDVCQRANVETKTIPGIYELIDGTVRVSELRNVELTDLLRRRPVQTDRMAIQRSIRGRRVLVTGGGGSIGRELCRQILECAPAELVLLGHGENSIFESERDLRHFMSRRRPLADQPDATQIRSVIADIRFGDRIRSVMDEVKPDIVFHAAAHKHVGLMERNPAEAISNNVLGTKNVVDAAVAADVQNLVMISTDKAVNPTNVMGASKRVAEMIVLDAARRTQRAFVTVRFGNVLGSRGSVVPIFQRQIAAGGPVTVTDPEVRRYFMTIPEAVQLVLQAGVLGKGGEVFLLDMGEPVRIAEMAETLIRLSGLEVGRDIEIVYTGLVPGEKMYEDLFVEGETYAKTAHQKIFVAANAGTLLEENLDQQLDVLAAAAQRNDRQAIIRGLQALVQEYQPKPNARPDVPSTTAPETVGKLELSAQQAGA